MTAKSMVKISHRSDFPDPISFRSGEEVVLGAEDTEFPGWVWVTTKGGKEGWAPLVYLKPSRDERMATTLVDYNARELDTEVGETLEVLDELLGWKSVRNSKGETGWVPAKTIEPI